MPVKAIRNHVIFKFEDELNSRKEFVETSSSGIILAGGHQDSASRPRWGVVLSAGEDCIDEAIIVGARILIENLKWTIGIEVDGEMLWRTDENHILCVEE